MSKRITRILFVVALAALAYDVAGAQEPRTLFSTVDPATTDLNDEQALLLARIRQRPTTKAGQEVAIVRLEELPAPASKATLELDVVPQAMKLQKYFVEQTDQGGLLRWRGATPQEVVSLAWTPEGDACAGLIYSGKDVFEVAPLGKGLNAMIPLDQSAFHPDEPPGFDKQFADPAQQQLPAAAAPEAADADAPPTEITVLVAYTPKVQDALNGNAVVTIQGAVGVANTSYINSKVNLRLKLVHTVEVAYTESNTHEQDLRHFRVSNDQVMDEVHKLRDQHKADLCILFIDNDHFCGLAAAILATPETAFAVVHYACAIGNLSFAHEVGHLQGARHNLENDPTIDSSYPWNHGYRILGTSGRTVMAYPAPNHPNRLPYWSNPDVEYQGQPTGTAAKQNNARMLNTSAVYLSNFR